MPLAVHDRQRLNLIATAQEEGKNFIKNLYEQLKENSL